MCIVFDKRQCQRLIHGYILIKYGWNSLKYIIAQEGLYYFPFNIRLLVIFCDIFIKKYVIDYAENLIK
jgi:hypothetical protein